MAAGGGGPWEDLRSMCPPGGELIALIEGVEFDPFLVFVFEIPPCVNGIVLSGWRFFL